MVYRRYGGGAASVLAMPFADGCELICHASNAEEEDRLFLRWAIMYQASIGFEEFKAELLPEHGVHGDGDGRSAAEILKGVKGIIG